MTSLYSADDIRNTYEQIHDHRHTKHIIQSYALNPRDIREVALSGLDLTSAKRVLDLGCGYGFFTEKLVGMLHEKAYVEGIDVIDRNNREAFEDTVDAIGYQGRFIQGSAELIQKMTDSSYDVVIASYSLYFFPHLIPDIARILSPDGIFLAVTHSKHSLQEVTQFIPECMQMIGVAPPDEIMINRLLGSFSLENGFLMLKEYFESVEKIIYKNDLYFPLDQVGDCINYLDKKKHLIFKEVSENYPDKVEDMLSCFHKIIYEHALLHGKVIITKDDAIFRCFKSQKGTTT